MPYALRKLTAKLLMIAGGVMLALVFAEAALRIPQLHIPNDYYRRADDFTGWSDVPNFTGTDRESGTTFQMNSAGYHDREHTKQKPPHTLRIALLGDSYTEAVQVPVEKTFCSVAEKKLAACTSLKGQRVEIINFGVGGYGTAQELITLRHRVWDYDPDIVVLAFFSGNDVTDNSYELMPSRGAPYFVHQSGKLVLDESHMLKPGATAALMTWLRLHSLVWRLQAEVRRAWSLGTDYRNPRIDLEVFRGSSTADWQEGWRVTEDLIVAMRDEVVAHHAKFLVVTVSSDGQVSPDSSARDRLMKLLGVKDLFYPDRRIRSLGEREGIPVLDLGPIFQQYADQHHIFLHGFQVKGALGRGHWNEAGHRLAGEVIADKICTDLLLPQNDSANGVSLPEGQ